ncbi:hypothetical protein N7495_004001 [Penicillium taxi]|uniref:uncharacterized protein n=1 Tax=Penicillium taxi TaxID=168475 RepID=UPI002545533F|nr:uncharacterized protein N7495_004001 [Penicillium taxi]KAJ5899257.1 hypothetical protein N7495_004001 [Penicillium taxi]
MIFTDEEAADVKKWVIKKLEDISDADSEVLADYVLALVRSDAPDDQLRKASTENLEDFLRENTVPFVNELFTTFGTKQGVSSAPPAPFQQPPQNFPQPTSPQQPQQPFNTLTSPLDESNSRKRSYNEGFQGEPDFQNGAPQNRNFKSPRRGRGGGRGDWMGRGGHSQSGQQFSQGQPGTFSFQPGFPPNDPMAAMMAMQGMGFPQMPGMPPMPVMPGAPGQPVMEPTGQPCPFYETQGICYLGTACPYQHGEAGSKNDGGINNFVIKNSVLTASIEYDPKTAALSTDSWRGGDRFGRGRGRGGQSGRGRGGRSDFASAGPNEDRSITTIVVEQIPDDKFNEESVREFFAQFGSIVDITLQSYKKIALIKFETYAEAKQAWSSPKVIFDNRFVKVYWHKRQDGDNEKSQPEAPVLDPEEFEKQQQEAQRAYEEKAKKRQEYEQAKQSIERQREELQKKQLEEKVRLLERLGDMDREEAKRDSMDTTSDENGTKESLRAQIAALESEAQTLGIDPIAARGGYRGRGVPRGRGGYRGRGAFDPSFRGGYRGRGGPARGRGGVLRLDNRPRRVAVAGVELNSDKDEALRHHLLTMGEYESVEQNPSQPDSVVVTFKERYQAEKFWVSPRNIPSVGDVELSWLPNLPAPQPSVTTPELDNGIGSLGDDGKMAIDSEVRTAPRADLDYDVAEDDTW